MRAKSIASVLLGGAVFLSACLSPVGAAVEANCATQAELVTLRGLGPLRAQQIVEERRRNGPYLGPGDLARRVPGLGPKRITRLQLQGLVVNGESELVPLTRPHRRRR